jgi:hypothetical protein
MSAPTYTEVSPSPQGEWYEDNKGRIQFRAQRILECAWTDVAALIVYLYSAVGASYPHPDGTTNSIVRRAKPRGRGKTGGTQTLISYSRALVDVYYDTVGPRWVNGVYLDEKLVPYRVHQKPQGGLALVWSDDTPLGIIDRRGIEFGSVAHQLVYGRMSSAPADALTYIGCCNAGTKSTFTLEVSDFAAQTVRYSVPSVEARTDYSAGTKYTVTYVHPINPNGWNRFWRGGTAAFEYLKKPDGTTYIQYPATW